MALKLLGIWRAVTQGVPRQICRQGGAVVNQTRPSAIGFKVRFLANSGNNGVKDFRRVAAGRMRIQEGNDKLKKADALLPSVSKRPSNKPYGSQKNSVKIKALRESEIRAKKLSSFAQSLKRQGATKDCLPQNETLKAAVERILPLQAPNPKNGMKNTLNLAGAKSAETGHNVNKSIDFPRKNKIIFQGTSNKKRTNPNSFHNKASAKGKSKIADFRDEPDLAFKGKNGLLSKRQASLQNGTILPEMSDLQAITRNSLSAYNLEAVSKSMNHLSGKPSPTNLQKCDFPEVPAKDSRETLTPKSLPELEDQLSYVSEEVQHQNRNGDVSHYNLDKNWEMKECESIVDGFGLPKDLPDSVAPPQYSEMSQGPSAGFSHGKSTSFAEFERYLKGIQVPKAEINRAPTTNPSTKKSLPQPFLCVMPNEIVKSKSSDTFPRAYEKSTKEKSKSIETFHNRAGPLGNQQSTGNTKSPGSKWSEGKNAWLADMRKAIQNQNKIQSKNNLIKPMPQYSLESEPGLVDASHSKSKSGQNKYKLSQNKSRSGLNELGQNKSKSGQNISKLGQKKSRRHSLTNVDERTLNENPIRGVMSADRLTSLTSKTQISDKKASAALVNKSGKAAMKASKSNEDFNKMKKRSLDKQYLKSHKSLFESLAKGENATLGIVKNAPLIHNKSVNSTNKSDSSNLERRASVEIPDAIVVESFDSSDSAKRFSENPIIPLSQKSQIQNTASTKGKNRSPSSGSQNKYIELQELLSRKYKKANSKSKKPLRNKNLAAVKELAPDSIGPMSEAFQWPKKGPFNISDLDTKSKFHRNVYKTYLGENVTRKADLPFRSTNTSEIDRGSLDGANSDVISTFSPFSSTVDAANSKSRKKKKAVNKMKEKRTLKDKRNDEPTEFYPGMDSSILNSLDGFMVMEAKPVPSEDPLGKTADTKRPETYPLFQNQTIDTGIGIDVNSYTRDPLWSIIGEEVATKDQPAVNTIFLDDQLTNYELNLARYHERARHDRESRREKRDNNQNGKREKNKKKPKKDRKNPTGKPYGNSRVIHL